MCSTTGNPIDVIADAIDQLAADVRGDEPVQDITARVAGLWSMMSALDPELARRQEKYNNPTDGTTLL